MPLEEKGGKAGGYSRRIGFAIKTIQPPCFSLASNDFGKPKPSERHGFPKRELCRSCFVRALP
jgi:hypothetical protein